MIFEPSLSAARPRAAAFAAQLIKALYKKVSGATPLLRANSKTLYPSWREHLPCRVCSTHTDITWDRPTRCQDQTSAHFRHR